MHRTVKVFVSGFAFAFVIVLIPFLCLQTPIPGLTGVVAGVAFLYRKPISDLFRTQKSPAGGTTFPLYGFAPLALAGLMLGGSFYGLGFTFSAKREPIRLECPYVGRYRYRVEKDTLAGEDQFTIDKHEKLTGFDGKQFRDLSEYLSSLGWNPEPREDKSPIVCRHESTPRQVPRPTWEPSSRMTVMLPFIDIGDYRIVPSSDSKIILTAEENLIVSTVPREVKDEKLGRDKSQGDTERIEIPLRAVAEDRRTTCEIRFAHPIFRNTIGIWILWLTKHDGVNATVNLAFTAGGEVLSSSIFAPFFAWCAILIGRGPKPPEAPFTAKPLADDAKPGDTPKNVVVILEQAGDYPMKTESKKTGNAALEESPPHGQSNPQG